MDRRGKSQSGFTLFELAAVMALIATLSGLSLYGLNQYLVMGQAAEAKLHIHLIADLLRGNPQGPIPCAAQPEQIPKRVPVPWFSNEGFRRLGFRPGGESHFQYEVQVPGPEGSAWLIRARGDLDGDGQSSLYELRADRAEIDVQEGLE